MATTTENPNTTTAAATDATNETTVYTGEFHGDLVGNADTATKLKNNWRLTIGGDADGYVDINAGDAKVDITVKQAVAAKAADQATEVGKAASASYAELANLATFAENSAKTELATRAVQDEKGNVIADTYLKADGTASKAQYDANGYDISKTYQRKDTAADKAVADAGGNVITDTYARKEDTVFFNSVKVQGYAEGNGAIADKTLTINISKVLDTFSNHVIFNALPSTEYAQDKTCIYFDSANKKLWIYDDTSKAWKDCFEQIVTKQTSDSARVDAFQSSIDEIHNDVIDIQNKQIQQEASITTNYNKNVEQDVRLTKLESGNITSVNLLPNADANNGGVIDFHYKGATENTSRISEDERGVLTVNGVKVSNGVITGTATNATYDNNGKKIATSINSNYTADAQGNIALPWQFRKYLGENYTIKATDFANCGEYAIGSFADAAQSPDGNNTGDYHLYCLSPVSAFAILVCASPRINKLYWGRFWDSVWQGWNILCNSNEDETITGTKTFSAVKTNVIDIDSTGWIRVNTSTRNNESRIAVVNKAGTLCLFSQLDNNGVKGLWCNNSDENNLVFPLQVFHDGSVVFNGKLNGNASTATTAYNVTTADIACPVHFEWDNNATSAFKCYATDPRDTNSYRSVKVDYAYNAFNDQYGRNIAATYAVKGQSGGIPNYNAGVVIANGGSTPSAGLLVVKTNVGDDFNDIFINNVMVARHGGASDGNTSQLATSFIVKAGDVVRWTFVSNSSSTPTLYPFA